ncbi:peptidoglycan/LPS O-acetylase OafA/YrhL [Xanthomonas arboricola]|nr:peptidoglycan/LPS O-acetylase OafA/YrhL [Xanthomonas sp. 3058]
MTRSVSGTGYFAHIDGLRALAVLSVIAYHLDASWLPGGFTGVDVFFVISGFVVSASVDRLPRISFAAELTRFYARRLRRIAPALLACLVTTALFSTLFIPESWLSEASTKTGRMAVFGLSNWVLASVGQDYFSPRAEFNPYTQTWSLGVEEQFYLLFPWMFLAWMRGGAGRAWSLGVFVLASAASLGYAWQRTHVPGHEVTSFYLTTARFWQLGAGVLLYQLMTLLRGRDGRNLFAAGIGVPAPLRAVLLLLALASIGNGLWNARPGHSPWSDGLWPVLGTVALLALLHRHADGWVGRVFSATPVVAIGRISYSLYLWHWPVLVVLRWTIGLETSGAKLLALVLTFACAAASYRWVELPWRTRRLGGWSNMRVVMVGIGALVLAAGVQSAVIKLAPYTSLSTVSRHPLDWYAYARGLRKELPDCRLVASNASVAGQPVRIFARGQCARPAASQRQVFVMGDSHALAYNELLRRFAVMEGGSVRVYGVAGCSVASMQPGGAVGRLRCVCASGAGGCGCQSAAGRCTVSAWPARAAPGRAGCGVRSAPQYRHIAERTGTARTRCDGGRDDRVVDARAGAWRADRAGGAQTGPYGAAVSLLGLVQSRQRDLRQRHADRAQDDGGLSRAGPRRAAAYCGWTARRQHLGSAAAVVRCAAVRADAAGSAAVLRCRSLERLWQPCAAAGFYRASAQFARACIACSMIHARGGRCTGRSRHARHHARRYWLT